MTEQENREKSDNIQLGRTGYRPFWVLKLSICIRALHQVGAAVFLTAFLLNEIPSPPPLYLLLAILSGIALLIVESMRHRQMLRELSGLSTFIKLLLLGAAYHGLLPVVPTILAAFILASISSHAPKLYRHRLLF
jgi:Ni/Fe-hydrogenase subunit HybB-like protein